MPGEEKAQKQEGVVVALCNALFAWWQVPNGQNNTT
jgi:hypothetical protein